MVPIPSPWCLHLGGRLARCHPDHHATGARPIRDILAPKLLTTFRHIEARGALETAHRTNSTCKMLQFQLVKW